MTSSPTRLLPVALLAAVALTASACGSSGGDDKSDKSSSSGSPSANATTADSSGCYDVPSGDLSDSVKVSGDFGKAQTATFKKPLKAGNLERTIVTKGTGETAKKGDTVNALITVYLGTGKSLGTQTLTETVGSSSVPPVFEAGASCLPYGTRTVMVAKAKDVYGAQGNPNVGITADDSMIVVTDVVSQKKDLVPAKWTKDVPSVNMSGKKPKVTLPKTKPPTQLELKVLKQGTGAVVKTADNVTVDYQGISWNTKKVFDQSYGKSPATFATDQVVQGFGAALVGQKVGTRLIVTMPPKYAYGAKGESQSQLAGQTLVFLIEIKATKTG